MQRRCCRLDCTLASSGRPGRVAALERFLDYIGERDRVWICRRIDIARHWIKTHPYLASVKKVITLQQLKTRLPARTIHRGARGNLRAVAMGCGARCRVCVRSRRDCSCIRQCARRWTLPSKRSSSRSFAPIRNWRGARRFAASLTPESPASKKAPGSLRVTPEEFAALHELNLAYGKKFGLPFVIAVRGHNPSSVIENLRRRIANSIEDERIEALRQIGRIAGFRLVDLVSAPYGAENPCDVG